MSAAAAVALQARARRHRRGGRRVRRAELDTLADGGRDTRVVDGVVPSPLRPRLLACAGVAAGEREGALADTVHTARTVQTYVL